MKKIKNFFILHLGLKGSFYWAYHQMKKGNIVRRTSDIGAIKYKLDDLDHTRIIWDFSYEIDKQKQ